MQATDDSIAHAHCMLDTQGYKKHTGCAILIACPPQQWLQERASVLRYTYIACLVRNILKLFNVRGFCFVPYSFIRFYLITRTS
jgi:hypothetical protein